MTHKDSQNKELAEKRKTAIELLLQGRSDAQVAELLGIDRSTIFRWRKSPPRSRPRSISSVAKSWSNPPPAFNPC